jgi:small-conductance mechanosensitive channel
MILDWYSVTIDALQNLWQGFVIFIPALLGAVIVFVIGWFISAGIGKLVAEVLKRIKFNQIFEKGNWDEALAKADIKVDASSFIGNIIKWVFAVVFLMAAVEILGLSELAGFLSNILGYLPNVVVAAFILVVAVIITDILEKLVRATVESIKVGYGQIVGAIVRYSIWIFAILAILIQLKVAPTLIQTLFTGLIAVIVIAAGLAFGLGGKELASEILKDLYKKLKS